MWHALFIREILSRLLTQRAAWFWLLVDPLAHVVFAMVLFSTIRERNVSGVEFALFLAIGVMGFKQFTGTALRSAQAVSANTALLAYRQVLPVDTVLVRAVVEGLLLAFVTFVLLTGASLFGFHVLPDDPLKLIEAYGMLWLMGAGLGLILSVVNTLSPEVGKVVGLAFTPLYFLSGVLFSPVNIPPKFREVLLYNPIVHGLELARSAFFPGYHLVEGVSAGYLAWWTAGALLTGLVLQRRFEDRLGVR
ncbi:ABC transporter permease [Polaromonas sp. JS666]|uniref:ABC transporter permease n=1 Tax=Polaromonas sp. (strain JS666 / ATCC BAA-500) TaxID=296591 RepID=UPI00067470BC|nr:ABC transporter permease [Polaromonas sp. JS666]